MADFNPNSQQNPNGAGNPEGAPAQQQAGSFDSNAASYIPNSAAYNQAQQSYQQPQQNYQAQQPFQQQPFQPQPMPVYQQSGPTMVLSGVQKAAWFFIGMFVGIAGILIASMCNIDKPYRSECTKWSVIGCFFWLAIFILFFVGGCAASMLTYGMYY